MLMNNPNEYKFTPSTSGTYRVYLGHYNSDSSEYFYNTTLAIYSDLQLQNLLAKSVSIKDDVRVRVNLIMEAGPYG